MAISKYTEDGKEFWKVYVHVRSSADRSRRIQKTITGLKTEAEARREEKKIIQQISKNVQQRDSLGIVWENVVALWWRDVKQGLIYKVSETSTQGRDLIIKLQKANLSKSY